MRNATATARTVTPRIATIANKDMAFAEGARKMRETSCKSLFFRIYLNR